MIRSTGRVPVLVAGLLFCIYALLNSGFDVTEGREDLALARRMADTGSIAFDVDPGETSARGPDGRFYLSHEIGHAVAFVPLVWIADRAGPLLALPHDRFAIFAALFMTAMYAALLAALFCHLLREHLGIDRGTAVLTTLALGLCTIMLPYARMLFDGVLAGLLLLAGMSFTIACARSGDWLRAAAAGACFGAAIAVRQTTLVVIPGAAAYVLLASMKHRRDVRPLIAAFIGALVPFVVWQGWYNAVRTGLPLLPAVSLPRYLGNNGLDGNVLTGLAGMLVSPGKSLLLFSPPLLLSVLGWRAFWRERRAEALLLLSAVVPFVLLHAALRNWAGDWGWGPRYLVSVTPLAAIPAAWALRRARGEPRQRTIALITLAAGAIVQTMATIVNWHYLYSHQVDLGRWSRGGAAWSLDESQFIVAAKAAAANVMRVLGANIPDVIVGGTDPLNIAASNSINVWWLTAARAGVSRAWLLAAVLAIAGAGAWFVRALWRELGPASTQPPVPIEPVPERRARHA